MEKQELQTFEGKGIFKISSERSIRIPKSDSSNPSWFHFIEFFPLLIALPYVEGESGFLFSFHWQLALFGGEVRDDQSAWVFLVGLLQCPL